MKRRSMRSVIKAYRASGHMFAQTFHTGTNWGKGYRPEDRECQETGCMINWYTNPCPCGRTFWEHPQTEAHHGT